MNQYETGEDKNQSTTACCSVFLRWLVNDPFFRQTSSAWCWQKSIRALARCTTLRGDNTAHKDKYPSDVENVFSFLMILITIDSHPADGGDANSLDTSDDRLPCGPWSLLGLYFNIHINMMISDQSINMSVIKTLLKVTNNFISLCQSRILRLPAVSTGCDKKNS